MNIYGCIGLSKSCYFDLDAINCQTVTSELLNTLTCKHHLTQTACLSITKID